MVLSMQEAFDLLLENKTIMVSYEDDSGEELMECNLEYILDSMVFDVNTNMAVLTDEQIEEVWDYLLFKDRIELWD